MSRPAVHRAVTTLTLVLGLVTACAAPAPTTPAATGPAPSPAAEALVFGTSTGYPPFAFYDDQKQLAGFDVALVRALGEELGVRVEIRDLAFDSLADALQLGQIQAAAAAISVTPERQTKVAFTNVYYLGEDAVLAPTGASRASLKSLADLGTLKVGVQRGTVFEQVVQTELVQTGKMPAANLFTYPTGEEAVQALKAGGIDAILMDLAPAQTFAQSGGVSVVATALVPQDFAIAVNQGDLALRDRLNQALAALQANGTLAQLYGQFLLPPPASLPTTAPPPPATGATAPPPPCVDALALESELTLDDQGNQAPPTVPPGAPFVKAWRVRNIGTCVWDGAYALVLADGEAMAGQAVAVTGTVPAGASHDLSQQLMAPASAGLHHGLWQMTNGVGQAFGERLDVTVNVSAGAVVTPAPSPTAVPGIQFGASPTAITAGEQVTFSWAVQDASSQYFYRQGSNWRQFPVGPTGSRVAWPSQTTTWELRAIMLDGTTQLQQITISVSPAPGAPEITKFVLNPPAEVVLGACVDVSWVVTEQVDSVNLFRGDAPVFQGSQAQGRAKDCPPQAGTVTYRLEAIGPDGTGRAARDLNVVAPGPTATAAPSGGATPSAPPQILTFRVWPNSLPAGYCLTVQWQVQDATRVRLTRGASAILDQAPLSGTATDCPITLGNVVYRLEAVREAGQSVFSENVVTVTAR